VPTVTAAMELLAPRDDVWQVLAEPHHLSDWWPEVAAVEPDRRGFAPGARWQLRGREPTLFRRAQGSSILVVRRIEPGETFAFHLVQSRLDAEVRLETTGPERTLATLTVSAPFWVLRFQRSLPQQALRRLYDLCQTAAGF
jgi:uncharacterized protein YndB with AHSA1/START domain